MTMINDDDDDNDDGDDDGDVDDEDDGDDDDGDDDDGDDDDADADADDHDDDRDRVAFSWLPARWNVGFAWVCSEHVLLKKTFSSMSAMIVPLNCLLRSGIFPPCLMTPEGTVAKPCWWIRTWRCSSKKFSNFR